MYGVLVTAHILFAGIWLTNILVSLVFKIKKINFNSEIEKNGLMLYLKYSNMIGMLGAIGILLSGIIIVLDNQAYGFFQFSANHWLVSKQIVMVIILALVFMALIPAAKNLKTILLSKKSENVDAALSRVNKISWIINWLVVLNILFALSRRFM